MLFQNGYDSVYNILDMQRLLIWNAKFPIVIRAYNSRFHFADYSQSNTKDRLLSNEHKAYISPSYHISSAREMEEPI
jgi:hypothetical protein